MCTMINKTLRNIYTMMKYFQLITEDVTDCDCDTSIRPTIHLEAKVNTRGDTTYTVTSETVEKAEVNTIGDTTYTVTSKIAEEYEDSAISTAMNITFICISSSAPAAPDITFTVASETSEQESTFLYVYKATSPLLNETFTYTYSVGHHQLLASHPHWSRQSIHQLWR